MKTTYYFLKTNDYNEVLVTDQKNAYCFESAPGGIFEGVNLYQTDEDGHTDTKKIVSELKTVLENTDNLKNIYDYIFDFPDDIFDFDKDEFNTDNAEITEIITVE